MLNIMNETEYKKAIELDNEGKYSEALVTYKNISNNSADPRYWMAYGYCLQKLCHWEQSINAFEKAIELKPHYCLPDTTLSLGISYINSGQKADALKQWRSCLNMKPEYPSYDSVQTKAKQLLEKYS